MTRRFSDRYKLARIRDEAILLDLETGNYFGVRGTALAICSALAGHASVPSAATEIGKQFDVSRRVAERDVGAFLAELRSRRRSSRRSIFRVFAGGYELRGSRGSSVKLAHDGRVHTSVASAHLLRAVAPHALALRGETVLHASSLLHRGEALAFVAASGTGKTTIAELLARRARILSEDLVAIDSKLRVRRDGERAIREWARSRKKTMVDHPLASCGNATAPLAAVMLVRRVEGLSDVQIERAEKIAGMAALFENAFVEIPAAQVWERALDVSRELVARRLVFSMKVPEGLVALERALREWSVRGFPRS